MFRELMKFVLVFVVCVCLGASVCAGQDDAKKAIVVKGASTTASLIQSWLPDYEKDRSRTLVVMTAATQGKGFEAFLTGDADICLTARALNTEERTRAEQKNIKLAEVTLRIDAVAIIVNKANPVNALSMEQLANMFSGKITNWKEVGGFDEPIQVLTLDPSSGMASFLSQQVFKKPFDPKAQVVQLPKDLPTHVKSKKGSLGFCRTDLAVSPTTGVKALSISPTEKAPAVELTQAAIVDGSYPIRRPLGLCYDQSLVKQGVVDFVEFCTKKAKEAD